MPSMDCTDLGLAMNIRVSKEDLDKINRTSVPLNDAKGGYLATLDVFHEIHCLNEIRKQVYRDDYPDWHFEHAQLDHVDHCLDIILQGVMCHGDITLQTFTWKDDYRWPWPNFNMEHECKSWDSITEWASQHSVPSLVGPIVSHPKLGTSL